MEIQGHYAQERAPVPFLLSYRVRNRHSFHPLPELLLTFWNIPWKVSHSKMIRVTISLLEGDLKCYPLDYSILGRHSAKFYWIPAICIPSFASPDSQVVLVFSIFLHHLDHCKSLNGFFLYQEELVDFCAPRICISSFYNINQTVHFLARRLMSLYWQEKDMSQEDSG